MINILSIDFEEWFRIIEYQHKYSQTNVEKRINGYLDQMLNLLGDDHHATFFILMKDVEDDISILNDIIDKNHEIALHGYDHLPLQSITRDEFNHQIQTSKEILKKEIGVSPVGYRAPGFSITSETQWAIEDLIKNGFLYDSSLFPYVNKEYGGFSGIPVVPFELNVNNKSIIEFPLSIIRIFNISLPIAGGGYFRVIPNFILIPIVKHWNKNNRPLNFYIHPRDLDKTQPRVKTSIKKSLRYYWGIKYSEKKFKKLLEKLSFISMIEYINEGYPLLKHSL